MSLFNQINLKSVRGDIFGGLTAAVIALPLALAFGVSSGAGAIAGVYGAIIVGFFAALFGGTATQVSGPTGPMTVIMALILTKMIGEYGDAGISIAFTIVILAGLLQIAFGLLKLGKYFVMVPYPVISGFMSGIGVIIILLQIAPLLGSEGYSSVLESVRQLPATIGHLNPKAAFIGILSVLIVMLWPAKLAKVIPSPLFTLVVVTATSALMLSPQDDVAVIGAVPSGWPSIILPQLSFTVLEDVVYYGFLLAVLGAIDSLLTSMVADSMTGNHHHSDKELIGQGIGNSVAGLFGALPGAGATMRTAINIRAGGRSALSGIIHSLTLLIIVLWAAPLAQYIPHAVLAGMLLKVGLDIIDWRFIKRIHLLPVFSGCLMAFVLLLTVFVDLITAVLVGMFIANLVTLDRLAHLQLDNISLIKGDKLFDGAGDALSNTLFFEIDGPISFAVSRELSRRLSESATFDTLVVDLSKAALVGATTSVMIIDLITEVKAKGHPVYLVSSLAGITQSLNKLGLGKLISPAQQAINIEQVIAKINQA